jgi:hypothetical protein
MSLDWNTKNCAVPAPQSEAEADERDRLIFASSWVGLSTITRDNVREWLVRLFVWHELDRGQLLGMNPLGALERWIGLETNVDDETREQWTQRLLVAAFERAEFKVERAIGAPA